MLDFLRNHCEKFRKELWTANTGSGRDTDEQIVKKEISEHEGIPVKEVERGRDIAGEMMGTGVAGCQK